MCEHYAEITALGAEVVAIGTGDLRYAQSFIKDERVPFPVLVDDAGRAARAASVRTGRLAALLGPHNWLGTARGLLGGHGFHPVGTRWTQLGATFVVGPGDTVRYAHIDRSPVDHAPFDAIFAALSRPAA